MRHRDIILSARRYCATLLREGARTWNAPEEFAPTTEDPDGQREDLWRTAIRDIAERLARSGREPKP